MDESRSFAEPVLSEAEGLRMTRGGKGMTTGGRKAKEDGEGTTAIVVLAWL